MGRAPCCDKNNVKRGPWSPEEDAVLKSYIDKHGHGGNWIALPQKAGLKRCGKSCRLRWLNYLRPDIKHGGFTDEEENIICSLYNKLGSRWSVIASHLAGRTDNDVKNYWNTKLKKKLSTVKHQKQLTTDQTTALQTTNQFNLPSTLTAPSLPLPCVPVIKTELYSHGEDFSKTLQPSFVVSNGSYKYYYTEAQPYTPMGLVENKQVVSPPVSDEISANSSSVTVENASSSNSLINLSSSDDLFFSEFSEFLNGYGDAAPPCYYKSVTYS